MLHCDARYARYAGVLVIVLVMALLLVVALFAARFLQ